ncbi:MAG: ATP-binding protein [Clostridia bacterium]|nr:ATP-binding protein [Clostridia bacterium]
MSYDEKTMAAARIEYRERVRRFEERERIRAEGLLARSPRLRETERELTGLSLKLARAALSGSPGEVGKIREKAEELHAGEEEILRGMGEERDALRPRAYCPVCEGSGETGKGPCACLLKVYEEKLLQRYARYLGDQSFENFDFEVYSDIVNPYYHAEPRGIAEFVFDQCAEYARRFRPGEGGGLYLHGGCGVGKSFLAASVAREVIRNGWFAHYLSAIGFFALAEKERFGRLSEEENADWEDAFAADLLILDDLGCEPASAQNAPLLYRLLGERAALRRGTVLVSTLTKEEIAARYSPAVESRISGSLADLLLIGEDLRKAGENA